MTGIPESENEKLLSGEFIEAKIDEQIVFSQLSGNGNAIRKDSITDLCWGLWLTRLGVILQSQIGRADMGDMTRTFCRGEYPLRTSLSMGLHSKARSV